MDFDSELDEHSIQKKYFKTSEEATQFFDDLGDNWAKRLVLPQGGNTFSDEWAKFIPGGENFKQLYVTWYRGYDQDQDVHSFRIKYFDEEASQKSFFDQLNTVGGYPKKIYGSNLDLYQVI